MGLRTKLEKSWCAVQSVQLLVSMFYFKIIILNGSFDKHSKSHIIITIKLQDYFKE